jgi:hypothetical protein
MPTFGRLALADVADRLPRLASLDTEAWDLPGAEILQLSWEVPLATHALLPPAMHPAVPPYATFLVTRYPQSPVGPFLLAQLRIMGRAGVHPRGLVLAAVVTIPEATRALRDGWGYPAETGAVTLRRRHDRITAVVTRDGAPVMEAALVNPEPIAGGDVQYIASVTLASVAEDGRLAPWLVQVDPHHTIHRAERGRPEVSCFDAAAWNAGPLRPGFPIAASMTTSDTDLPRIRFVMHPETPVVRGTRRIR